MFGPIRPAHRDWLTRSVDGALPPTDGVLVSDSPDDAHEEQKRPNPRNLTHDRSHDQKGDPEQPSVLCNPSLERPQPLARHFVHLVLKSVVRVT